MTLKKSLIYLLFITNLAVIVYFWYNNSGSLLYHSQPEMLISLGRLFGLLGEYFILIQLLLIGRVHFIERVFGHDRVTELHHRIGLTWAFLIFLHPVLLAFGYSAENNISFWSQFLNFLTGWEDVLKALIGLAVFIVAIILSIYSLKDKLKYEHWHFAHFLMYGAIALVFGHQINTGDMSGGSPLYYWLILNFLGFGLLLLYRFIRPFYLFYKFRFKVTEIKEEVPGIISIYISGKDLENFKFSPGQFAIINFLDKKMWTSHPFSFSAAPNGKTLRFTAKALGDYTNDLKNIKPGTEVMIDGPLGTFTEKFAKRDKFLLIAGGIGITPIIAMLESMSNRKDIVLIYGNRDEKEIPFIDFLKSLPIKLHLLVSNNGPEFTEQNMKRGKISREILSAFVPDLESREIYLCGPAPMMRAAIEICEDLGARRKQIHFEKFYL